MQEMKKSCFVALIKLMCLSKSLTIYHFLIIIYAITLGGWSKENFIPFNFYPHTTQHKYNALHADPYEL